MKKVKIKAEAPVAKMRIEQHGNIWQIEKESIIHPVSKHECMLLVSLDGTTKLWFDKPNQRYLEIVE